MDKYDKVPKVVLTEIASGIFPYCNRLTHRDMARELLELREPAPLTQIPFSEIHPDIVTRLEKRIDAIVSSRIRKIEEVIFRAFETSIKPDGLNPAGWNMEDERAQAEK